MDRRYKEWFNEIETAARQTIGKTAYKEKSGIKMSKEISELQRQKRDRRNQIQKEDDACKNLH